MKLVHMDRSSGDGDRSFGPRDVLGLRRANVLAAGLILLLVSSGCHGRRSGLARGYGSEPIRAIWVTRWDYKTPGDIARVMDNCKVAGFNTVLFQVRGNGTAFYRSRIEPWADELGGRDPGFDPLAIAIEEAHRRGLSLHAWVNVIPGWRGDTPPTNPRQRYNAHADWFWRDAAGRRQPLGWYVSLNPCYPKVRRYLTAVMQEIVANYPVDGLHLDYIRFPNEWNDSYPRGGAGTRLSARSANACPVQAGDRQDAGSGADPMECVADGGDYRGGSRHPAHDAEDQPASRADRGRRCIARRGQATALPGREAVDRGRPGGRGLPDELRRGHAYVLETPSPLDGEETGRARRHRRNV